MEYFHLGGGDFLWNHFFHIHIYIQVSYPQLLLLKLSIGLLWNLAGLFLRMEYFHLGGGNFLWNHFFHIHIYIQVSYPQLLLLKLSIGLLWNLAGLFLRMRICALAILIWICCHLGGGGFWGKFPPKPFLSYTICIGVSYLQLINYPLDT